MHAQLPPSVWRQATRMLAACAVAYAATGALHLNTGYWAMITVMVVVQGNLGGTLDAGLAQLAGTLAGGAVGMAGVWLRAHHLAPNAAVLLLALAPLALLSAANAHFRTGPVTALIVLLVTPTTGSSLALATGRIEEIAIGSVIAVAVSVLVLPGRARAAIDRELAAALRALADMARRRDGIDIAPALAAFDHAMGRAATAHVEWTRERAVHLAAFSPVDPLLAALRRLRTDLALLHRAATDTPLPAAVPDWFAAAADAVMAHHPAPPIGPVLDALPDLPDDTATVCITLVREDLAALATRIDAVGAPGAVPAGNLPMI